MSQFIEMFGDCVNRIKLSSLCSTFVDGDWVESKDQSELGIRLIQTGNVGNGFFKDKEDKSRYISEETFDNLHCTEIYPGDILVSRLPDPIGRACIIPQGLGRTITAVDCTIIRLKDIILPDYFIAYTMTPSYVAQINEVTTGTTRRRVSRANLGNILIPCPSIAKQQQFVAIAKQADKSKFGDFKSQFIEMFGNTSKGMLGKFTQVIRGVSYKPSDVKTADDPDTAVILRSNNINDANLNTDEVVYIDKNRVSGDQYLRVNDIVVCASNGSKALVGKAAINKTLTNQYAHGAFCLLVRPNDNINPVYLNTFFQTSLYKKQIDELAAGSNILNIKQEHLTNMILPLPIIEEQNKFAIIAEQADKSKSYVRIAFKNLESMLGYCIRQIS